MNLGRSADNDLAGESSKKEICPSRSISFRRILMSSWQKGFLHEGRDNYKDSACGVQGSSWL